MLFIFQELKKRNTEGLVVIFFFSEMHEVLYYILSSYRKLKGFPYSKNIPLHSLPQFLSTVGTTQKWAMEMKFTVRVHHAV